MLSQCGLHALEMLNQYSHYSLLATVDTIFNLGTLGGTTLPPMSNCSGT
jgi:hypothetical protein